MPQMGESIAEGTIVRWMKKVGDAVDRDEPLFEISTDKVDAEIPSPAAGVLTSIAVSEGQTVPVNSVVGTIGAAGDAPEPPVEGGQNGHEAAGRRVAAASTQPQGDGASRPPRERGGAAEPAAAAAAPQLEAPRQRTSPLVRRIAKEHNVDVSRIPGSGTGGRVTKNDILGYLQHHQSEPLQEEGTAGPTTGGDAARVPASSKGPLQGDRRGEIRPLSVMRRKIAEHMVLSRRTSAHVHTVFHVNFATIERIRREKRAAYEARGVKLTYMSFIAKVIVEALRRHPLMNASLDGENVVYKKDVNLGIAVALEGGLIVPVIRNADEKSLLGLSRAIADVAERARTKQLKPEEVQDGTFTITNPGSFGAQFGLPIINQPQVAILGVGTIEKRPVVIDDAIGIRPMAYLALGFDHQLIDGALADQFMADVKQGLEQFDGETA